MIERTTNHRQLQNARRQGVAPSITLRPHFLSLARQVQLWVQQRSVENRTASIGVTSLAARVGRSTVSFNLASAMTSVIRNRVILVESDFGKHFISRKLGSARALGLSDLLLNDHPEDECPIIETPVADLFVLGCGQKSGQDALELPFERIPKIVEERLREFEIAVFDLPVANNLTSCYSIAWQMDGIVLTIEAKRVDQRKIARFRKQMENFGVEIVGVVLNKS